jgi:hypothetical protein
MGGSTTRDTLLAIETAYRHQRGLSEDKFLMGPEHDFFWSVIGELVNVDHDEILYWTFLEPNVDDWLLVLIDDELRLAHFGQQEAEIRLLGHLQGEYVERIREEGSTVTIELSFEDSRLPNGKIAFESQIGSGALKTLAPLRERFREWSKAPPPFRLTVEGPAS